MKLDGFDHNENMSAADFKALGDNVNVHLLCFVAECEEYGEGPQVAWDRADQ